MSTSTQTNQHKNTVRNERGQFAAKLSTPLTQVRQAQVDANVTYWLWLSEHGYNDVSPSEVFAGAEQPNELDQMDADLINLRLTDSDWEAPFARLTSEQLGEIERERPGEEISNQPYLY